MTGWDVFCLSILIHRNIDIILCKRSSQDSPVSTLSVSWPPNSSQLLLAVTHHGYTNRIALVNRALTSSVHWPGFSRHRNYTVDIYGLVEVVRKRLSNDETRIFSIDSSRRVYVSPNPLSGKIWIELNSNFHRDSILSTLKSQNQLQIQVNPMDYKLDTKLPHGCSAALYFMYNEKRREEYVLVSPSRSRPSLIPPCSHRGVYTVQAVAVHHTVGEGEISLYRLCATSCPYILKIYSSKNQLLDLLGRAKKYCLEYSNTPDTYTIKQFYTDRPRAYFKHVMEQKGGLMEKYLKDNRGDQFSPINKRIKGLMFSGSLDTRHFTPPFSSQFGNQRLFIPAKSIFGAETNMFFADFYCRYDVHYVTVVLTKKGSIEDRFCKKKLIQLDKRINPFFTVEEPKPYHHYTVIQQKTFRIVSVHKFQLEFFYTENINIVEWLELYGPKGIHFETVEGYVKSKSWQMGKNPSCLICNLPSCLC